MTPSDFPNQSTDSDQSAIAKSQTDLGEVSSNKRTSSNSTRPWLAALGAILLLVGGGLGWRWWQASQSNAQGGPPGAMQGVPVALEPVETSTIQDASEFVGRLESDNSVTLRPEIEGRVSQIYVSEGEQVEPGTPLVQLRPEKRQAELASVLASVNSARAIRSNAASELQALEAERIAAVAEVELQNEEFRRTSTLVSEGALSQQELDRVARDRRSAEASLNAVSERIQAARASLAEAEAGLQQAQANANLANEELQDATIVAPFAGTVGDIPIRIGDFVSSSDTLTTVTQNQSLDIRIAIPLERESELRPGLTVELMDGQGNPLTVGEISFISPQVNVEAQSILVKATFNNSQGRLRDGQFVRARVIWDQRPGLLVPTSAISRLGGQTFVFVATPPEQAPAEQAGGEAPPAAAPQGGPPGDAPALVAEQRLVQLGDIQGNSYQVVDGLQAGEQIVTSGILNLSDGVPIMPQEEAPAAGNNQG